ncbi:MAG: acetylxylan esterase [Bacteroidales bacterium]
MSSFRAPVCDGTVRFLLVLCLLGSSVSRAQEVPLLKTQWKFRTGDDPAWAQENLEESQWIRLEAGAPWEDQGVGDYDGYAWYRQDVYVPADLEEEAGKHGGLVLDLGRIDDADMTFWNGALLGSTGSMPPDDQSAYDRQRSYRIPLDAVRWGATNHIAVRVYDQGGGGGLTGGRYGLHPLGLPELVEIRGVFSRDDHLVLEPGPVRFRLEIHNQMAERLDGFLELRCRSDFGELHPVQTQDVRVRPGRTESLDVDLGPLEPGFYAVHAVLDDGSDSTAADIAFGVRPGKISSPADRPDDFMAYWDRARKELAGIDPQYRLIRQDELCTAEREVYLLEMRSLGNVRIRGWYARPVADGPHPAVLHLQGYSSTMTPGALYGENDMVALGLNIRGHGNSRDHVDPGFPGYLLEHLEDPELYIYRGAYMDCLRALDFLFSRSEVDTARVAVAGASQGGALSIATAALAPERVALCLPAVPFLSDFPDYFRVADWPANEFRSYLETHPDVSRVDLFRTLGYVDIKNLAPWVKAPVFLGVGLKDATCPPHINFAAYNLLSGRRQVTVYPEAGHALPSDFQERGIAWMRSQFGLEPGSGASGK